MAYIHVIPESEATGQLGELYKQLAYADGSVDDAFKVLSLNPALLAADATMYRQALYGDSPLARTDRELLAVTVSRLNGCQRCLHHHTATLDALQPDGERDHTMASMGQDKATLSTRQRVMVAFAERLTREPAALDQADINCLRDAGLDDRTILDLCNVVSYFNYANRMTLSLGVGLEGGGQHAA
jgi:uncharacterized peroxidase-related enzyme